MRRFDTDRMLPEFERMLSELRVPRSREQEKLDREAGGRVCVLPTPQLWGAPVFCQVKVSGERRHIFQFHIQDTAYIILNLDQCTVQVQAKAKALWGNGWERWLLRWAGLVSWWMRDDCWTLDAVDSEWRVTGIELCCDFVGLDFHTWDMYAVVAPGVPTKEVHRTRYDLAEDPTTDELAEAIADPDANTVETFNIGRRSSNVSWCIYDKTTQLGAVKDGDASTYEPMWSALGWDGQEPITRVELRMCKRGLVLRSKDGAPDENGEVGLDLRVPSALCERENLARVWASLTESYRLVDPTTATRKRRCHTDWRWKKVQAAVSTEKGRLVQDRAVQGATWKEAAIRSARTCLRAMQKLAAMHSWEVVTPEGYGSVARLALEILRAEEPDIQEQMRQHGRDHHRRRYDFLANEIFAACPERAPPGGQLLYTPPITTADLLPEAWRADDMPSRLEWEQVRKLLSDAEEKMTHELQAWREERSA